MSENITYVPFKPGMSIKSGESVFVFVDGVTVETFQKDEDFRSGTITAVVAGKVRIAWDETISVVRGGMSVLTNKYEYVEKSRLTRIERGTWVLDHKSEMPAESGPSDTLETPEESEMAVKAAMSGPSETPEVPAPRRSSRTSGTSAKSAK